MTVTYTGEVATVRGFGCFLKLLFRWRGSIYKLVWPDLFLFLGLYYSLNLTYRFVLEDEQKRVFESVVDYCETYSNLIPLSFVLGFYVSIVMTRWWDQYTHIPWPDPLAVYVSSNIHGQDERGRLMRRTIMRYCCLCLTMTFSMISPRVKKRFPTLQHFVEAGLLLENEKAIISDLDEKFPRHAKHWLPIVWAASIVTRARKEGRIRDDFAVKTIIDELNTFRGSCGQLLNYDSISVPLVYTQVVTLAVYSFFGTCIIGRQFVDRPVTDETKPRHLIDLYLPVFTLLQFFFYMGWLKVAESLINPFGEDDDDFEVNWLVDRNLQVSYLIVDEMHHEHPELIRDQYWDEVFPTELPYTIASEPFREEHPQPSTANIEIPKNESELLLPSSLKIDQLGDHPFDDNTSGIHFTAGHKRSNSRISHRERTMSGGSAASFVPSQPGSMANSINRVASITNVLRTIFSRENSQTDNTSNLGSSRNLHPSHSSASLTNRVIGIGGTTRIADQVIEEVDEQATVTSMRKPSNYPNVLDIFPQQDGRPPPSAPVDVPMGSMNRKFSISTSAPTRGAEPVHFTISSSGGDHSMINAPIFGEQSVSPTSSVTTARIATGEGDDISIGSTTTEEDDTVVDEFTRLKKQRQQERKKKLAARLARSISAHQAALQGGPTDTDALLADITGTTLVFENEM